ncbi:histidine--tRNA ligase [Polaribacter reichenbachii]|uniref:Histidine--tRNA ligase n=1 Tax=Polaribacter reichenbachii TaxID=996801 RepID=A0A1B8TPR9_9FLAO|nr:histidine--tRNA ligase [Polaribacter reichenbachii]APZ46867.1 histidine--tRNA ligase [Polaribacter reichenbachii]AUC17510.1 histidine--tRNA ligase [Polaribacter reichenbachii]OBY61615.1 histidine--tRNA ligase [Polaribacter reichenbachii]
MKPSIPKGTRDFSPTEVANRTYIMNTIKTAFETFGFQPIETPSFENSSTLMGKYGEEGDRLIFKILNSGDYFKDVREDINKTSYIYLHFFEVFDLIRKKRPKEEEYQEFLKTIFNKIYNKQNLNDNEKNYLKSFFSLNQSDIIDFYTEFELKGKPADEFVELLQFKRKMYSQFRFGYLNHFQLLNSKKSTLLISEKALRYDLTVPFARYVVQHQNEITFPFKRYQVQPVWRADRPQKGRFREFYQCDADVVGSKSLWQEVEFIKLYDTVFTQLGLEKTTIKINNRKILSGIAEVIGAQDKLIDFTVALDKLDKIGQEKVEAEMLSKGISEQAIRKVQPLFSFNGTNEENLDALATMLQSSEEGIKGVEELRFVINSISELGLTSANLEVDVTLARGLNYYTGAIFEVSAPEGVKMGSIGGGGRYDDLTGIFGLKDVSGVGISFGLDRIYLVLEELGLFKSVDLPKPKVLFINFGDAEALYAMKAIAELRKQHIKSELYPDAAKMKKQMNYANKREIEFVVLVGSQEVEKQEYTLKNMVSGEQTKCSLSELIDKIK